jgi:hypothetical protein
MSFGHQSDVHNHMFPKRPLFSHKVVEDERRNEIVEPVQNEQMRLGDPPTKREEPMSTRSSS